MNNALKRWRACLAWCAMLASINATSAPVSKYVIEDDEPTGAVLARVYASFHVHAYAAARWYRQALDGRIVNTVGFQAFRTRLETATLVSFTYYYQRDGVEHSRIYHAMSGRSNFERELAGAGRGGTPVPLPPLPYPAFFTYTPGEVVTWDIEPLPGSGVTHSPVGDGRHPDARRRDAELKIARKVELDIASGTVEPGGALFGFSSQLPCPSCERALEALSDSHGIDVTVTYFGPHSAAYKRFHRLREQYVNSIHVAVNGGQMNLLQQELVVEHTPAPVDCVEDESTTTRPTGNDG